MTSTNDGTGEAAPRWFAALLLLLLAAGVYVRCVDLGLMEYKRDEFYFIDMARKNAEDLGSVRSLHAAASLPHPPGTAWFLTVPVALTDDPVGIAWSVVLVNLIGLAVLFLFLRSAFAGEVALWGTTLFASIPYAVLLSRKIWNGDLIFPFAMIFCAAFFSTLRKYRPWKVVLTFVALGVMAQMHLSTWIMCPALIVFLVLLKVRARPRDLLVGALCVLALFLPYFMDLMRIDAERSSRMVQKSTDLSLILHNLRRSLFITTGLGLDPMFGDGAYERFIDSNRLRAVLGLFAAYATTAAAALVFFAVQTVVYVRRVWRTGERTPAGDVTAWFVILYLFVMTVYAAVTKRSAPHHVVLLYPLFPLVFVLLLHRLQAAGKVAGIVARTFLVLVVAGNLFFVHSFHCHVAEYPDEMRAGRYGLPYRVREQRWSDEKTRRWEASVRRQFEEQQHLQQPGRDKDEPGR